MLHLFVWKMVCEQKSQTRGAAREKRL